MLYHINWKKNRECLFPIVREEDSLSLEFSTTATAAAAVEQYVPSSGIWSTDNAKPQLFFVCFSDFEETFGVLGSFFRLCKDGICETKQTKPNQIVLCWNKMMTFA